MGGFVGTLPFKGTLNNGLVAFYNLEEATGSAFDSGPYGLTLTRNNGVTSHASLNPSMGNAASFLEASIQYFSIVSNPKMQFSNAMSISMWINQTSKVGASLVGLAGKWSAISASTSEYQLGWLQTTDRLTFRVRTAAAVIATSSIGSIALNTWYHLVGTFDASGSVSKFYVNAGTPDVATPPIGLLTNSTQAFLIGINGAGSGIGGSSGWNGYIDAVGLWDRTLTPEEVSGLYCGGLGRQMPNL